MDTTPSQRLLRRAQRLQAIAQAGLAYSTNAYDLERFEQIRSISVELLTETTDMPYEKLLPLFAAESGYPTPKVDVRAVLFKEEEQILLVREKVDGNRWTLPGGWADVGYTPFEVAAKETEEETGLKVRPIRLLALLDKRNHPHPPQPWYVYKAFILCEEEAGQLLDETPETSGARWFGRDEIPGLDLSTDRVTFSQLEQMLAFASNPDLPTVCD